MENVGLITIFMFFELKTIAGFTRLYTDKFIDVEFRDSHVYTPINLLM